MCEQRFQVLRIEGEDITAPWMTNIHRFSIEDGDMTVFWGFKNADNENIAFAVGRRDEKKDRIFERVEFRRS